MKLLWFIMVRLAIIIALLTLIAVTSYMHISLAIPTIVISYFIFITIMVHLDG